MSRGKGGDGIQEVVSSILIGSAIPTTITRNGGREATVFLVLCHPSMTERARIFISHSAADSASGTTENIRAHDVRVAIRQALENDSRLHVLVDEVELKAGDAIAAPAVNHPGRKYVRSSARYCTASDTCADSIASD